MNSLEIFVVFFGLLTIVTSFGLFIQLHSALRISSTREAWQYAKTLNRRVFGGLFVIWITIAAFVL
jgi:hypothetical protein